MTPKRHKGRWLLGLAVAFAFAAWMVWRDGAGPGTTDPASFDSAVAPALQLKHKAELQPIEEEEVRRSPLAAVSYRTVPQVVDVASAKEIEAKPDGCWLRVSVVDDEGRPLAGAHVVLAGHAQGHSIVLGDERTGVEGIADLSLEWLLAHRSRDPNSRARAEVTVACAGWRAPFSASTLPRTDDLSQGIEHRVQMRSTFGRSFVGRAVDSEGNAIADATIVARNQSERHTTRSLAGGYFLVSELRDPTDLQLSAAHTGFGVARRTLDPKAMAQNAEIGDLILVPQGVLAGRVVGLNGHGIGAAACTLQCPFDPEDSPREIETGADGSFRFADLEPELRYQLALPGLPLPTTLYQPGSTNLMLEVEAYGVTLGFRGPVGEIVAGPIRHEVCLDRTSGPSPDARKPLERRYANGSVGLITFTDDALCVVASSEAQGRSLAGRTAFRPSERGGWIDVALRPTDLTQLDVEVLDPNGQPVHRWRGELLDPVQDVAWCRFDAWDDGGRRAPPGSYRLRVEPATGAGSLLPIERLVEIPIASRYSVSVQSKAWGGHVRVTLPELPSAQYMAFLCQAENSEPFSGEALDTTRSDRVLGNDQAVPAGAYWLHVRATSGDETHWTAHPVTVRSGEVTDVSLTVSDLLR